MSDDNIEKIPDSSLYVGWNLPQCFKCQHSYTEGSVEENNIQKKCDIDKKPVDKDIFFGHKVCPHIKRPSEVPDNV